MKAKWFIVCWLSSTIIMFGLSYVWHGVLLNDYVHIKYPMWMYFLLAGIVYLVIGLMLTYLYHYTYVKKIQYKGMMIGACLGFMLYLVAFVLGVSFNQNGVQHIVVDFLWQMLEQGIGGGVIGTVFGFLTHMHKIEQADQ